MLVPSVLRSVIVSKNNTNEEESNNDMNYLILHVIYDDKGNATNTWELVKGRQAVVDAVYDAMKENGYYNFFKSNIISEKINMTKAISVYSFIRKFLEADEITLDNWGIENIDDFNDYIFYTDSNVSDMSYQGIDNIEDLDKFYNADIQHKTLFDFDNEEG